jgi:hypothetical protein
VYKRGACAEYLIVCPAPEEPTGRLLLDSPPNGPAYSIGVCPIKDEHRVLMCKGHTATDDGLRVVAAFGSGWTPQ